MEDISIRRATAEDAVAISKVLRASAEAKLSHEFTDEGAKLFQQLSSPKAQAEMIDSERFIYWVAESEASILGLLSVSNKTHVFHFFVHPDELGKGIGRKLWQGYVDFLLEQHSFNELVKITVNASGFAVPIYNHLGFVIDKPQFLKQGLYITPMSQYLWCLQEQ